MMDQLEGKNSVLEALRGNRQVKEIYIAAKQKGQGLDEIRSLAREQKVSVKNVEKEKLDKMAQSRNHQGVIAMVEPYRYQNFEDVIEKALQVKKNPLVILLDGIEDPHNLGSIIRSAEVFGASAVIIPKNRAVGVTPTVAKIASGALEHVPVLQVVNLTETIKTLKKKNFWIAAGVGESNQDLSDQDLRGSIGLVIGSEGKGISRLVREHCDYLLRIPMAGKTGSLNASVAAGVLLYEVFNQNRKKKELSR
ncbi:23S rRNA (guanosine2251-2'-O)-methyltransferase [Tindallia magadiensis]|uniref:23S rRNA (Guanosine2251-2'-O)-methyltransferase n=1 Tax=Tindallia magadiensis TaxID=69895 RepID=A0A1I3HPI0_9FIRM|nr:23S rRNA (guanosine(2251)-2'-O)-methyltransferase RlmB [Tindallia magadiensis]SFI37666.1 23S rRNA (guanosine2251-2'-O)-methyltransferase [Tindallia magadiensis]